MTGAAVVAAVAAIVAIAAAVAAALARETAEREAYRAQLALLDARIKGAAARINAAVTARLLSSRRGRSR